MSYDSVRNYYEKMVYERIGNIIGRKTVDPDYLEDVACVTLNHLPPKYYRHEVDMIFYMSPVERKEIEDKVEKAILDAVEFIKERRKNTKR